MIGGCLFKENQWYELDPSWASKLEALRQDGGAPVFQAFGAEQYGEVVRAEMAAAYMRGGVSLAMANALSAPKPGAAPKKGARASAFAGMSASDADLSAAASSSGTITTETLPSAPEAAAPAPVPAPDEPGEVVDVDTIRTHKAADELAARYGVNLDGLGTVSAKKDKLAEELFTPDDDSAD